MKDHGREVVDDRRVPMHEETSLEQAIVGGELIRPHRREIGPPLAERAVEPGIERAYPPGQRSDAPRQASERPDQGKRARHAFAAARTARRGRGSGRQLLAHAHHLLHESPVDRVTRQHRQQPVPVQEVVVDATPDEAEHAREHVGVFLDCARGHADQPAEFAIHLLVAAAGERERQWRGEAAVALDDVGVVPDRRRGIRVGSTREGRDRATLQQVQRAVGERPFDVLRHSEVTLCGAGEGGDPQHVFAGEHCGLGGRRALDNGAVAVDAPGLAFDGTGDEGVAAALRRGDDGDRTAPRHRIGAESHARCVAVDHLLDDHGRRCRRACDSGFGAIADQSHAVARDPHPRHVFGDLRARHVEEAVELPGQRMRGAVLVLRRRANGVAAGGGRRTERRFDRRADRRRQPNARGDRAERGLVAGTGQLGREGRGDAGVECVRQDDEPGRHRQSRIRELRQRACLAADRCCGIDVETAGDVRAHRGALIAAR